MKQKLTALLLVLLLAVTLVLPVMAAAPYVDDEAAILTLSEVETLEARAAEISEHYGVGVYICIVDDFGDYGYPTPRPRPIRSTMRSRSAMAAGATASSCC